MMQLNSKSIIKIKYQITKMLKNKIKIINFKKDNKKHTWKFKIFIWNVYNQHNTGSNNPNAYQWEN